MSRIPLILNIELTQEKTYKLKTQSVIRVMIMCLFYYVDHFLFISAFISAYHWFIIMIGYMVVGHF